MNVKNLNTGNNTGNIGDSYTYNIGIELNELSQLLLQIQSAMNQADITEEEREEANEYFDVIKEESKQNNPRKHLIKVACDGLKRIISSPNYWSLGDKIFTIIKK